MVFWFRLYCLGSGFPFFNELWIWLFWEIWSSSQLLVELDTQTCTYVCRCTHTLHHVCTCSLEYVIQCLWRLPLTPHCLSPARVHSSSASGLCPARRLLSSNRFPNRTSKFAIPSVTWLNSCTADLTPWLSLLLKEMPFTVAPFLSLFSSVCLKLGKIWFRVFYKCLLAL